VRRIAVAAGEAAVVLEAGMSNGAAAWQRVAPLLAPHVRVAAYDRAGIGGSSPPGGRVTVDGQVEDLASDVYSPTVHTVSNHGAV
jgi:pimeloyl-ACP methyl ester carboxylesterase